MQFSFCFVFLFLFLFPHKDGWGLQVRFCHMDIEWCWGFSFEEEWQESQEHGQDPVTGPLCVVVDPDDQPWSGGGKIKDGLCFVEGAGLHNPRGN